MPEPAALVASAVLLGLSGGVSPGPLLVLLVAETLRHGMSAGIKVSLAPLVSDLPIVCLTFVLLKQVSAIDTAMAAISAAGAILLMWLGYKSLRWQAADLQRPEAQPRTLTTAVMINLVNPHPYLFWLLIGGPIVLTTWAGSGVLALLFVLIFYSLLIGSKVVLALLVHRSREFLRGRVYVWTLRITGLALMLYALVFAHNAARTFAL